MSSQPSSKTITSIPQPSHSHNRSKGLKKLGVSEDDVLLAGKLLKQNQGAPSEPNKAEKIFGYTATSLARGKALRLLGTTEEEVDVENAKVLGSLGVAGRRRSFSFIHSPEARPLRQKRHRPHGFAKAAPNAKDSISRRHTFNTVKRKVRRTFIHHNRRRSSDSELRRLRHAEHSETEIEALKERIAELERRISLTPGLSSGVSNGMTCSTVIEE